MFLLSQLKYNDFEKNGNFENFDRSGPLLIFGALPNILRYACFRSLMTLGKVSLPLKSGSARPRRLGTRIVPAGLQETRGAFPASHARQGRPSYIVKVS